MEKDNVHVSLKNDDPLIIPYTFWYEQQPFHKGLLLLSGLNAPLLTPFI